MGKKSTRKFEHESLQDAVSLADYLDALKDGFAKGRLTFSDKEGDITIEPQGLIHFNVRAEQQGDRVRLAIDFSWKDRSSQLPTEATLKIHTGSDEE